MSTAQVLYMTPSDYFSFGQRLSKIWTNPEYQTAFLEDTYNRVSLAETDGCVVIITTDCRSAIMIAGVSGWYNYNYKAIMRWHGILAFHRGHGLSRVLLEWIKKDVKEKGYSELYELSDSEEAKTYFETMGFV